MTLKIENKLLKKDTAIPDSELWDKFRGGCEGSYIEIYDRYVQVLFRYGLKLNRDEAFVKDCIQELFIDLWKKHTFLGPTTSIKFYLFRAFRRKIHRSLPSHFSESLNPEVDYFADPSFEDSLIALQEAESKKTFLLKKVEQLPKRQKEVIFLRYFEELSHDEVASLMCISKTSVYMLVSRSIETLRKITKK
jgi:RNA polymerase sigma factor (sigma-70 family)